MTLAKGQYLTQSEFDGKPVSKENYIEHTYEVVQILSEDTHSVGVGGMGGGYKRSYVVRLEVVK